MSNTNLILGKEIVEIRVRSFFLHKKLMSEILVVYIKVEGEFWFKFTNDDGINYFELLDIEPAIKELAQIQDDFAYPIKQIDTSYVGKRIVEIKNYKWHGKTDEVNGFFIMLDDAVGFSIFNNDDNLFIQDGRIEDDNYVIG